MVKARHDFMLLDIYRTSSICVGRFLFPRCLVPVSTFHFEVLLVGRALDLLCMFA